MHTRTLRMCMGYVIKLKRRMRIAVLRGGGHTRQRVEYKIRPLLRYERNIKRGNDDGLYEAEQYIYAHEVAKEES